MAAYGRKPALGWVGRGGATLRTRRTLFWGLSVVVKARFLSDGAGTLIQCRSRLTIGVILLLGWFYLWTGAVAASLLAELAVGNMQSAGNLLAMVGLGVGLLVIVHVVMIPHRNYARDDFPFLIDFIAKTTEAEILED